METDPLEHVEFVITDPKFESDITDFATWNRLIKKVYYSAN